MERGVNPKEDMFLKEYKEGGRFGTTKVRVVKVNYMKSNQDKLVNELNGEKRVEMIAKMFQTLENAKAWVLLGMF